ncbi:MAG: hypothetical protein IT285_08620 [Bdellovibrionales bacterium]|nr:hypothetical protein [Bdellovibrionales bacterium]
MTTALPVSALLLAGGLWLSAPSVSGEEPAAAAPAQETQVFSKMDSVCVSDQHLIEDLRAREKKLEEERLGLASKEAELLAREAAVNEQIQKLEEIRKQISGMESIREAKQEEQVGKLVQTMERMSPKAAAGLIDQLDEKLAVSAMVRIETSRLAKIMNVLSPEKSSRLSEIMTTGRASKRDPAAAKGGNG